MKDSPDVFASLHSVREAMAKPEAGNPILESIRHIRRVLARLDASVEDTQKELSEVESRLASLQSARSAMQESLDTAIQTWLPSIAGKVQ